MPARKSLSEQDSPAPCNSTQSEEPSCSSDSDDDESVLEAASDEQIWGYGRKLPQKRAVADLTLPCDVLSVRMSPCSDQMAVATVDGNLNIYNYNLERCTIAARLGQQRRKGGVRVSDRTCRALEYSGDGGWLFSGWSNGTVRIHDMHTGALKRRLVVNSATKASSAAAGVSCVLPLTARIVASGDDDGCVSLCDYRARDSVMRVKQCEDYITDLLVDDCEPQRWLVASSAEGTVTSFCLRTRKVHTQCDMYDAPLCGMTLVKGDRYLVAGMSSEQGQLNIFKWPHFGQHASLFKGHPSAVTSLVAVSDSLVAVGYEDGSIRLCNILPHKYVGVIGRHRGEMPIEQLCLSRDEQLMASCAHDRRVCLWNVGYVHHPSFSIYDRRVPDTADPSNNVPDVNTVRRRPSERRDRLSRGDCRRQLPSSRQSNTATFFSDLPKKDDGCFLWD